MKRSLDRIATYTVGGRGEYKDGEMDDIKAIVSGPLNIALVGMQGVAKSAMIKAMLNALGRYEDARRVLAAKGTCLVTREVYPYFLNDTRTIRLYDYPGLEPSFGVALEKDSRALRRSTASEDVESAYRRRQLAHVFGHAVAGTIRPGSSPVYDMASLEDHLGDIIDWPTTPSTDHGVHTFIVVGSLKEVEEWLYVEQDAGRYHMATPGMGGVSPVEAWAGRLKNLSSDMTRLVGAPVIVCVTGVDILEARASREGGDLTAGRTADAVARVEFAHRTVRELLAVGSDHLMFLDTRNPDDEETQSAVLDALWRAIETAEHAVEIRVQNQGLVGRVPAGLPPAPAPAVASAPAPVSATPPEAPPVSE